MPSSIPEQAVEAAKEHFYGGGICWEKGPDKGAEAHGKVLASLTAALPHLEAAFRERVLSDDFVRPLTEQIVEGSDGEVISLAFATVRDALADVLGRQAADGD